MNHENPILIVGAGIGGLTLALMLERAGVACQVFESATSFRLLGVGINVLPHATRELAALGLEAALLREGIETREASYFNRHGQLILTEPLGRGAGYSNAQVSIHRGHLHRVLLQAFRERIGDAHLRVGWKLVSATQGPDGVMANFAESDTGVALPSVKGAALIGCDGIHSTLRRQLFPDDGEPVYSGVNMWRGTTRAKPILSGATMVRAGWLATGKMVIYPIRDAIDDDGRQLVNWVAEIETPDWKIQDWSRRGEIDDFIGAFADWRFDWCDVPALIGAADSILEYPMVDKDPLTHWSVGRLTLLGDAAHPMFPRGSNGAGQSILDARALTDALARNTDVEKALADYSALRCPATAQVVLANRRTPPDTVIEEVWRRTGDAPFDDIDKVISKAELQAIIDRYKVVAGYAHAQLGGPSPAREPPPGQP